MKNILLSLSFLSLMSCEYRVPRNDPDSKVPALYPSPNSLYKRDSLYIWLSVYQFFDKEMDGYRFYYQTPMSDVHIDIDTIMYSPDTLKLIAFAIEHISDTDYDGNGIAGYRPNTREPWTICPFRQVLPTGFENYNHLKNVYMYDYFNDLKDQSDYFWDSTKNDWVSLNFHNVSDPQFWNSIIWKKGSKYPGLYMFETRAGVKRDDTDGRLPMPKLVYPDSLLEKYHKGEGI